MKKVKLFLLLTIATYVTSSFAQDRAVSCGRIVGGEIVGSIAGGYMGASLGGWLMGTMYDYGF